MCYWTNAVGPSTQTGPKGWLKFAKDHLIKDRKMWRTMVRLKRVMNLPMRPKKRSSSNWKWLLPAGVHPSDIFPFHSMSAIITIMKKILNNNNQIICNMLFMLLQLTDVQTDRDTLQIICTFK